MDDERVVGGAAFGAENFSAGTGVERVGGKSVNRLGRHGDELARAQPGGEPREIARRGAIDAGGGWRRHGAKKAGARDSDLGKR